MPPMISDIFSMMISSFVHLFVSFVAETHDRESEIILAYFILLKYSSLDGNMKT